MQSPCFIFCERCNCVPFINIKLKNSPSIEVKCRCNNYLPETYPIEQFLLSINALNEKHIKNRPSFCKNLLPHKKEPVLGYCPKCNVYTCNKCVGQFKHAQDHLLLKFKIKAHFYYNKNHPYDPYGEGSFCVSCRKYFSHEILNIHREHSTIQLKNDKDILINNIEYDFIAIKKRFQNEIVNKVEKYKNNSQMIDCLYNCQERNESLFCMIKFIIYTYKKLSAFGNDIHLLLNLINNTEFNYNNLFYSQNFLSVEEEKKIINEYNVIKENSKFYKDYTYTQNEMITIEDKLTITAMLLMKESQFILSFDDGSIMLYNIDKREKDFIYKYAHCYRINDLCKKNQKTFFSCSDDFDVKLWCLTHNSIVCLAIIIDLSEVKQIFWVKHSQLITLNSDAIIKIWTKDPRMNKYILHNTIIEQIRYNLFYVYYSHKQNILVYVIDNRILFYENGNLCKKDKRTIEGLYLENQTYYENENGQLFIGGGLGKEENYFPKIFIINLLTKTIDCIIDGWNLFERTGPYDRYHYFSFIGEKNNELLWFVPNGNIVSIKKGSLEWSRYTTRIEEWLYIKKTIINKDCFISLSENKNYIRLWTIN